MHSAYGVEKLSGVKFQKKFTTPPQSPREINYSLIHANYTMYISYLWLRSSSSNPHSGAKSTKQNWQIIYYKVCCVRCFIAVALTSLHSCFLTFSLFCIEGEHSCSASLSINIKHGEKAGTNSKTKWQSCIIMINSSCFIKPRRTISITISIKNYRVVNSRSHYIFNF